MNIPYVTIYIEILALCFLTAAIIRRTTRRDLGSEGEINAFQWMLRVFMAMMVLDGFTQLHYQQVIHPPLLSVGIAYALYMSFLALLALVWFYFVELQINAYNTRKRLFRMVSVLPCLVMVGLCFGSLANGAVFSFGENGLFVRGPLFFLQNVVAYLYILYAAVHAFLVANREASLARKRRLRTFSAFAVAPVIGGILQLVIGGFPFIGPAICISTVMIFVNVQADMIHMDFLTGLNNRSSMEHYMEELLGKDDADARFCLFMIDADNFKYINDTFGHVEGDRALRLIANALRTSVDAAGGFIARFGGDEFVAIMEDCGNDSPDFFIDMVNANLRNECRKNHILYPLHVTIGHVQCAPGQHAASDLLKQADQVMYEKKREKKQKKQADQTGD